jgi:RNA 3'-terminal phosphate cyclase (ATP)
MHEIDGSHGEGGGQLLRTACALSAVTGEAVRLMNIRARRVPAGLAPQHLAAVKALAALSGADVEGLALRATELVFRPGQLRGGEFHFDIGTAGSITLVLQALLPAALCGTGPTRLRVTGGTDVRAAPPLDYLRFVLLPLLARMGVRAEIQCERRGYYPRGGGEVVVAVEPGRPRGLRLEAPGAVQAIRGAVHVANLPAHIGARMRETATRLLGGIAPVEIGEQHLGGGCAIGQGGAAVVWAHTVHSLLGGAEVAQRGIPAERIAANAAEPLRADIAAGATLDVHAADQLLVYAALATEPSCFRARRLSSHAQTTIWLLQRMLPVRVATAPEGSCVSVTVEPAQSAGVSA